MIDHISPWEVCEDDDPERAEDSWNGKPIKPVSPHVVVVEGVIYRIVVTTRGYYRYVDNLSDPIVPGLMLAKAHFTSRLDNGIALIWHWTLHKL